MVRYVYLIFFLIVTIIGNVYDFPMKVFFQIIGVIGVSYNMIELFFTNKKEK